jgi:hypothetical protein
MQEPNNLRQIITGKEVHLALNMEPIHSFKMLVTTHKTMWHHNPENQNQHIH